MKARYEDYKDSRVAWIGQVPAGWEVRRLSQLAHEHYISNKGVNHQNLLSLSYGKVIRKDIKTTDGLLPQSFGGYQIVEKGNIILRLTDLQNDHKSLRVGLVNEEGIITSAYLCLQCTNAILPEYLYLMLHVNDIHKVFYGMGAGVRQSLNYDGVRNMPILLPPLPEQHSIAAYLDQRCRHIDAYTESLEREAALVRQLKSALIAQAVTRGLDPSAPMKDSGVSWIGQVPAGWEVRRAKFMFKKNKRPVRPEDEVITCFRDGQVTLRKNRRTEGFTESLTEFGYQGIRKGDLVIHQMDAFAGSIGVSDSDGKGTSVYHCCTPKGDYDTKYYAYLIRQMAYSGFIQSLYRGIRERSSDFSFNVFGNQYLVVPPLPDQRAIAAYLDERCAAIEAYVASLEREVSLARDLKQSEISDCVTGKVRVC